MPTTFLEGLLSGVSHPAVGLDHLTFMVVLGLAAAFVPAGIAVIASFVVASLVGVVVHAANFDFPYSEQLVAISVILAGLLLMAGYASKRSLWLPFAIIAGLIHGYAFGETILGADRAVIGAYMIGVFGIVAAITVAVMLVTSKALRVANAASMQVRAIGIVVVCIGAYLLVSLLRGN